MGKHIHDANSMRKILEHARRQGIGPMGIRPKTKQKVTGRALCAKVPKETGPRKEGAE